MENGKFNRKIYTENEKIKWKFNFRTLNMFVMLWEAVNVKMNVAFAVLIHPVALVLEWML